MAKIRRNRAVLVWEWGGGQALLPGSAWGVGAESGARICDGRPDLAVVRGGRVRRRQGQRRQQIRRPGAQIPNRQLSRKRRAGAAAKASPLPAALEDRGAT